MFTGTVISSAILYSWSSLKIELVSPVHQAGKSASILSRWMYACGGVVFSSRNGSMGLDVGGVYCRATSLVIVMSGTQTR